MRSLVRWLYRLARIGRDAEVLSSGDPDKITGRIVNKLTGRYLVNRRGGGPPPAGEVSDVAFLWLQIGFTNPQPGFPVRETNRPHSLDPVPTPHTGGSRRSES